MTKPRLLALLLAAALVAPAFAHDEPQPPASSDVVRYDHHRIVRVQIDGAEQLAQMLDISDDFWGCEARIGVPLEFRVPPEAMPALEASGLKFDIIHENYQTLIDAERDRLARAPEVGIDGVNYFADFRDYNTTSAYVDTLVALNPAIASRFTVGNSIEGRNIFGIRITGPGAAGSKPGLHIQAIQHAREWAVLPVAMWAADQLIRQYGINPVITDLVNSVEFHIIPIVNPDGYVYTWGPDRNWRKNRRNNGGGVFGVDPNRNWSVGWGGSGSSGTPSSESYRGTAPFSEPETSNVAAYILARPHIRGLLDFHANAQLILLPWGYTFDPSPIHGEHVALGEVMTSAIQAVNGVYYEPGPSGVVLYLSAGNVRDWTYGEANAYPATIEVRNTGQGFVVTPNTIAPTNAENFQAILAKAQWVKNTKSLRFDHAAAPPMWIPGNASTPVAIKAWALPGPSTLDNSSVNLRWRRGTSGAFNTVGLTPGANDTFTGSIPAMPCGGGVVQYYYEAQSTSAELNTWPSDAPTSFFTVPIGAQTPVFSDNFTSNLGWTVGATGDTATAGVWARVDPISNGAQPEDDNPLGSGTQCYITQQTSSTANPLLNDVDGGHTSLTSPVFNGTGSGDLYLTYYRWFSNNLDLNRYQATDNLTVLVSTDGGANWSTVEVFNDNEGKWTYKSVNLSALVTPTSNMRLRFVARDSSPDSAVEAGLDDVNIFRMVCDTIPGDINGDGVVNFADLNILLSNFGQTGAGIPGDINGDGAVNFADLNILLSNFGQGV